MTSKRSAGERASTPDTSWSRHEMRSPNTADLAENVMDWKITPTRLLAAANVGVAYLVPVSQDHSQGCTRSQ